MILEVVFIYMHERICQRCLRKSDLAVDENTFVSKQVLTFHVKDDRIANKLWKSGITDQPFISSF